MNQFFQCPFKWKLLHINHVQTVKVRNEKKELGSNIHEIIANYYKGIPKSPTAEQIEKRAWTCFNTYFEPRLSKFEKQAKEMMENFIKFEKSRLPNYIKPCLIEGYLEDEEYKGYLDFLAITPKEALIIDWKTGAMMTITDDNRRQGKIYERLGKNNKHIMEGMKVKILFVTLRNGRQLEVPFTTMPWLDEQRRRMFSLVNAKRFPKIHSALCDWCECQIRCEFEGEKLWDNTRLMNVW